MVDCFRWQTHLREKSAQKQFNSSAFKGSSGNQGVQDSEEPSSAATEATTKAHRQTTATSASAPAYQQSPASASDRLGHAEAEERQGDRRLSLE